MFIERRKNETRLHSASWPGDSRFLNTIDERFYKQVDTLWQKFWEENNSALFVTDFKPAMILPNHNFDCESLKLYSSTLVIFKTLVGKCKCTGVLPVLTVTFPGLINPRSVRILI